MRDFTSNFLSYENILPYIVIPDNLSVLSNLSSLFSKDYLLIFLCAVQTDNDKTKVNYSTLPLIILYCTSCRNILEKLSFLDTFMMTMKHWETRAKTKRRNNRYRDEDFVSLKLNPNMWKSSTGIYALKTSSGRVEGWAGRNYG